MGFLRRTELLFDPQVERHLVSLVPAAAACRLYRRLLEFVKTQQGHVKRVAASLRTGRDGELHVMKLPGHAVSSKKSHETKPSKVLRAMGSLIKKRRKRMRKKKHKKMLKRTRFQRRAAGK